METRLCERAVFNQPDENVSFRKMKSTVDISRNIHEASERVQRVTSNIGGVREAAHSTSDNVGQLQIAADEVSRQAAALADQAAVFLKTIRI